MHLPDVTNTSLLVLCGGTGTRMGGQDKPLLAWQGVAMVDRVLESVPADMPKIISANRNLDAYGSRADVVTDQQSGLDQAHGPLVGVYVGLAEIKNEWLLVAPGDGPLLPDNWWRTMFAGTDRHAAVVAHDGARQQHLHLLLHQSLKESLADFLGRGRFEVYRWLEEIQPAVAQFDDPRGFTNVNSPSDLA